MYERRTQDDYPGQTSLVWEIAETWRVYSTENPTADPTEFRLSDLTAEVLRNLTVNEATATLTALCQGLTLSRAYKRETGTPVFGFTPSGVSGSGEGTRWSRDFA